MTVSLETVPRGRKTLEDAVKISAAFPEISVINVPDLLRFPLRSWEACGIIKSIKTTERHLVTMPHIRAIDFSLNEPFPLTEKFIELGIEEVLVISGDPPNQKLSEGNANASRKVYQTEITAFIKKLKIEMPRLKIYAAFDPYRTNIRYELDYLKQKEDSGARGFLSQPFFDLRLLEIYAEYLEGKNIYWGIAPVLSAASRNYWESLNRAIFPRSFRPSLAWNVDFGKRVLNFCESCGFNIYLMPIKVDLEAYLSGIFS